MSNQVVPLQKPQASVAIPEGEMKQIREQVEIAIRSRYLPQGVSSVDQALTIAFKGRELGIPPMHAFSHIHVINGKPTISAELMLSLIFRKYPKAKIQYLKNSAQECVIKATRPGDEASEFSFTIQEAHAAQLTGKDSWKKYPAAMLRARTISVMARALFPDALMGASYTPEELGADVDEEGVILTTGTTVKPEQPGENDGVTSSELKAKAQPRNGTGVKKSAAPVPTEEENERMSLQAKLGAFMRGHSLTDSQIKVFAFDWFGVKASKDLTNEQFKEFLVKLEDEFAAVEQGDFQSFR